MPSGCLLVIECLPSALLGCKATRRMPPLSARPATETLDAPGLSRYPETAYRVICRRMVADA